MRGSCPELVATGVLVLGAAAAAVVAVGVVVLAPELVVLGVVVPALEALEEGAEELEELGAEDGPDELELLGAEELDEGALEVEVCWLPASGSTYCWSPAEPPPLARAPVATVIA